MQRSAFELIEEALQLLRAMPIEGWSYYLLGSVPFLLALTFFLRDMATGYAAARCWPESLLCTLVFLWAAVWKTRFAGALARQLRRDTEITRNSFGQCCFIQVVLQSLKVIVFPLALISILPLAWTCAFFRTANVEADQPGLGLAQVVRRSAKQASAFPRSTWGALLILLSMGIVISINVFIAVVFLPELSKIFTGFENEWTRNRAHLLGFNLIAIVCALTWFIVDPLVQAYFAVRWFYDKARSDGRDLLNRLRQFAALILLTVSVGVLPTKMHAAQPAGASHTLSHDDLERGMAQALGSSEFEWQRAKNAPEIGNSIFDRISRDLEGALDHIRSWVSKTVEMIGELFRKRAGTETRDRERRSGAGVRWWMISIAAVLILCVGLALFRSRKAVQIVQPDGGSSAPDATSDELLATELPDEEWLRIARAYLGSGDTRLAIRAMYLSNLAHLAARQLITVQRWKSNGIYERELQVRARTRTVISAFAASNRVYEWVWYGLHEGTTELVESFERDMKVIRSNDDA